MKNKYIVWAIVVNIFFTLLLFGYILYKEQVIFLVNDKITAIDTLQNQIIAAVAKNGPAVVSVFSDEEMSYGVENKEGSQNIRKKTQKYIGGTAFFIDSEGYLLTSKHVVEDISKKYFVLFEDGTSSKVQKIWMDPHLDLAVLSLQDKGNKNQITFPVVDFVYQEGRFGVGSFALSIGTPFSQYTNTSALGIISAINRTLDLEGGLTYTNLYQLDMHTNPGNSGGPIFTIDGKVFGLVTAMASQSSQIGFAIPLSQKKILQLLSSVKQSNTLSSIQN